MLSRRRASPGPWVWPRIRRGLPLAPRRIPTSSRTRSCSCRASGCHGGREILLPASRVEGCRLGTVHVPVAGSLDAIITVILIMPAGGSYQTFYGDPGFWIIGIATSPRRFHCIGTRSRATRPSSTRRRAPAATNHAIHNTRSLSLAKRGNSQSTWYEYREQLLHLKARSLPSPCCARHAD